MKLLITQFFSKPMFLPLSEVHIFCSVPCSNTHIVCAHSSLNTEQVSHPYKTTGAIILLYVVFLTLLGG
jgi:hypothetical protein